MMATMPPVPDGVALTSVGRAPFRYPDVLQDGRVALLAMPHGLGATVWKRLQDERGGAPMAGPADDGVLPILTRLVIVGTDARVRITEGQEVRGAHAFAQNDSTAPRRLYLNMWLDVYATAGRIMPPEPAGELVHAGRVFAEHVFTRPFAPPGQRKVTELALPCAPRVPTLRYEAPPPDAAAAVPADGVLVGPPIAVGATHFSLDHCDQNQHVNSLVYPQLVIEAGIAALAAHTSVAPLAARELEVAYRRPSFAGDVVHLNLQCYRKATQWGVCARITVDGEPKPRIFARVLFG